MGNDFFEQTLSNFMKKKNKLEEQKQNKEFLEQEEKQLKKEQKELEEQQEQENLVYNGNLEFQLNDMETKLKKTKFKNRYKYEIIKNKLYIYLDNIIMLTIDIPEFLSSCCFGDLAHKVFNTFYFEENFWTLKKFIEDYCIVYDYWVKPQIRISRHNFIDLYKNYCLNILNTNKFVNFNNFNALLEEKYDECLTKYNGKSCLTKIVIKSEIKEKLGLYDDFNSLDTNFDIEDNSLVDFIEKYCDINVDISPQNRILRTDFKKAYHIYVEKYSKRIEINDRQFNSVLNNICEDPFIKSNGIWYMKKIKFKNFK